MSITNAELNALAARINNKLLKYRAQFIMSVHFSLDRVNDIRNNPPITLNELEDIFNKVIEQHIMSILVLNHGDTFNIKCRMTHINMPCAVEKRSDATNTITHKNIVITVMRKQGFRAKDAIEFTV